MKKIVLCFSGGLDTSAIVLWLKQTYDADVIAYCCDVGNLPPEEKLREKAFKLGASDFIFEDLKDNLAQNFVFPLLRSGAQYQGEYFLGTAIARPLIAERVAYYSKIVGAEAISHGATGKGNDQIRFERAWAYLAPDLKVVAPWKEWEFKGRQDLINYLAKHGFEYDGEVHPSYSVDANLFHNSTEGNVLEDIGKEYNEEEILQLIQPPSKTMKDASHVTIQFENGLPVSINDEKKTPAEILQALNQIGGQHGIGIVDLVEERVNGIKSRGIYETPGGTLLYKALQGLKQICWGREVFGTAAYLGNLYANLVYDGLWHSDARNNIEAYFAEAGKRLTGSVGLKLIQREVFITHRQSEFSLYNQQMVSFEEDNYGINKAAKDYCKVVNYSQWQAGKVHQPELS